MAEPQQPRHPTAHGAVGLAVVAVGMVVAAEGQWPPDPEGDDDRTQFSAGRALSALDDVLEAGPPARPSGSAALRAVQDNVVDAFEAQGHRVDDRTWLSCSDRQAVCGRVRNLRVRVPGRSAGPSILLVTHTDSVAAGPGVADAGANVAILLEVSRALYLEPAWGPVDLLLTDGEEVDLLGARAFVSQDPAWDDVAVVVNLEARGTEGRSWMFEVTDDWLVETYASVVPHPATTSVATAVYRNMPVDTDLSVFRRSRPGLGLAFIGGAARYHTPLDDRAHLDPGSVQQQGEAALLLVRALSARLPEVPPVGLPGGQGPRAWTDLYGLTTLVWPAAASHVLVGVGLVGAVVGAGQAGALAVLRATMNLLFRLGLGLVSCVLAALLVGRLGVLPGSFPHRLDAAAGLLLVLGAFPLVWRDPGGEPQARLALTSLLWSGLAAVLHRAEPAASWVLAVPAAVGGVAVLLPGSWRGLLPMVAASIILPVFALVLPEALGAPLVVTCGLLGALWATWLPPLTAVGGGRSAAWILAVGAVVGVVLLLSSPPFTPDEPQGATVRVIGDGEGSRVITAADGKDPIQAALTAAGLSRVLEGPPLVDGPSLTPSSGGASLHLRSQRGATTLRLTLEEPAQVVRIRYPGLAEQTLHRGLFGPLTLTGVPDEGVEVDVSGTLGAATLTDSTSGLPADLSRLRVPGPGALHVPIHQGDTTEVVTTLQLGAAAPPPPPSPAAAPEAAPWD